MRKRYVAFLLLALPLSSTSTASAQKAVIVVRHAEKISETDQRLSEAGRARAERLAAMLKDAGVTAIYVTDTERAKDTARPLADARKLTVRSYDVGSEKVVAAPFAATLRREHVQDVVLVVGHSNTVPAILRALGCQESLRIESGEYDNLFVVLPRGKNASLVRLRY
jgi:broad specificity phosphatase PhoE